MSENNTTINVWADEDIVAQPDLTSSGQKRVNLFFVDFFNPEQTVMVHLGPKQALEIIEELQQALLDLIGGSSAQQPSSEQK